MKMQFQRQIFTWLLAVLFLIYPVRAQIQNDQTADYLGPIGGSQLWTPLNLGSTLVAWWDAQYTPNLTFNGSNISAWTDRQSGIVASQGTGANQPGWSGTARNGKAGLTFNGSSQQLSFGSNTLPTGTNASFMAVAAFTSASGNFEGAVSYGTAAAGQLRLLGRYNTNNAYVSIGNTDLVNGSWLSTDAFLEGAWSSVTQSEWLDGTAFGPSAATFNTVGNSGNIGSDIGAILFNGTIQQVVGMNVVPSTCQRQKLEGWESWYDGKAGSNLPSNHPYKSAAPTVGGSC
jgi:hypothetical protein